ncbi:MAG: DUF2282 domain-containing protein [Pseudomonadota bacterium]
MKTAATLSAITLGAIGVTAVSSSAVQAHYARGIERCYGVVAKGMNDCATDKHACAGVARADRDPSDWIYVARDSCKQIAGGRTDAPFVCLPNECA